MLNWTFGKWRLGFTATNVVRNLGSLISVFKAEYDFASTIGYFKLTRDTEPSSARSALLMFLGSLAGNDAYSCRRIKPVTPAAA